MQQEMIIYISKATGTLTSEEVKRIAALSASKNLEADVTGLLLHAISIMLALAHYSLASSCACFMPAPPSA